jgi:DNA-binding LacI/PurR family transcriptional regulator
VRIPGASMAARAVETVFELMAGQEVSLLDRVEPAELVVRESCGARRR